MAIGSLGISYLRSNESVRSALDGLEISRGDRVFAITGSGDFSFAAIGRGAEVHSYDYDRKQVSLVDFRERDLGNGNLKGFRLYYDLAEYRNRYFDDPNVIKSIRANLLRLFNRFTRDFVDEDLGGFNKFFLSNALLYEFCLEEDDVREERVRRFTQKLPEDCLVYISSTLSLPGGQRAAVDHRRGYDRAGLVMDTSLTAIARRIHKEDLIKDRLLHGWTPGVFRKSKTS